MVTFGYRQSTVTWLSRRFAERNMVHAVVISRMDFPADDGAYNTAAVPLRVIYTGPARVSVSSGSPMDFAGEEQHFLNPTVSTPLGPETQVEDMVEVTDHDDPEMVGKWFRVVSVDAGGQFPSFRQHQVTGAARFPEWTYVNEPGYVP